MSVSFILSRERFLSLVWLFIYEILWKSNILNNLEDAMAVIKILQENPASL